MIAVTWTNGFRTGAEPRVRDSLKAPLPGMAMSTILYILILFFMAAVVVVLIRGLVNMMRGGSGNLSNKLMQMRIVLQFVAVVLIVAFLWITGGGR